MTNRDNRFAARIVSIPVVAGLLTVLWVSAADAKPVASEYRVPGHCVVTTEIKDDGRIITNRSCGFTDKDYACLKATGKVCKR